MAHFAQIDENNIVLQVVVVANENCLDESGAESEPVGVAFCQALFGADTRWKQTSYNGNFRRQYAGEGYSYSEASNVFIETSPYPSWVLNETLHWVAPVAAPTVPDIYFLSWNEENQEWDAVLNQGAV